MKYFFLSMAPLFALAVVVLLAVATIRFIRWLIKKVNEDEDNPDQDS